MRTEESVVTVGSLRLSVTRRGGGAPLLLIGGLGNARTVWAALVDELPDVETVAVDPPGMGASSMPQRPLTMTELAAVYAELIPALDLASASVLGFSFGGSVAQQLAHQSPHLVDRLVLCGTGPGVGGVRGAPSALRELSTPWRYYSAARLRRVSPVLYGGRRAREPEAFWEEQRERLAAPPSFRGYYFQLSALAGWSSLSWLTTLQQPTLVLAGDEDPIFPVENAHLLGSRIPRARVEILRGSGHLFIIDSAEEIAPLIDNFIYADPP